MAMNQSTVETGFAGVRREAARDYRTELVPVINHLIRICKDGEYGFRTAAVDVKSPACANLFATYAQQRAQFAYELQNVVRKLGFQPAIDGSIVGLIHREWIDLRSKFVGKRNMHTVLEECERGEDSAVKAYAVALRFPLGNEIAEIVDRQFNAIKTAHENIRSLRDMRHGD